MPSYRHSELLRSPSTSEDSLPVWIVPGSQVSFLFDLFLVYIGAFFSTRSPLLFSGFEKSNTLPLRSAWISRIVWSIPFDWYPTLIYSLCSSNPELNLIAQLSRSIFDGHLTPDPERLVLALNALDRSCGLARCPFCHKHVQSNPQTLSGLLHYETASHGTEWILSLDVPLFTTMPSDYETVIGIQNHLYSSRR